MRDEKRHSERLGFSNNWCARHRDRLVMLARLHLHGRIQHKLDPSDLVQQTFLEAHKNRDAFRGKDDAERLAWLKRILLTNILNAFRELRCAKRDVARECSLDRLLDDSSACIEAYLAADDSSVDQRALKAERIHRTAAALLRLPRDQREVISLRYIEGLSLKEIAERTHRTPASAAGLLKRGLQRVRSWLPDEHGS